MGAEPVKLGRPPGEKRKLSFALVLLVLVGGAFVYVSYRPVTQLRSEPAPGFIETRREWDAKRRAAEERVARAYWEAAVENVQVKYPFGTTLPENPPAGFSIQGRDFPGGGFETSAATRARYWQKLREVWPRRQAWETSYQWSTLWAYEALSAFQAAVWRTVDGIIRQFKT